MRAPALVGILLLAVSASAGCNVSGGVGTAREAGIDDVNSIDDAVNNSNGDLPEGDLTEPSIEVVATIKATARAPAGEDPEDFDTEIVVVIKRYGIGIEASHAEVKTSLTSLTLSADDDQIGRYTATHDEYHQRYTLELSIEGDPLDDLSLEGPEIHTISEPNNDSNHDEGEDLAVSWAPSGARKATVRTLNLETTEIDDNGSYVVDGALFVVIPPTEETEDFVEIERTNSTTGRHHWPRGGPRPTASMSLSISVKNHVVFDVQP